MSIIYICKIHGGLTLDNCLSEKNGEKYYYRCKECRRTNNVLSKRGITKEIYNEFMIKQNNTCLLCLKECETIGRSGEKIPLSVDHCHKCKKVRALLCMSCNKAIGK